MACWTGISDWFRLKKVEGVVLFVGGVMLKRSILGDVVAKCIEVSCCARDESSIFYSIMEDRE